MADRPLRIVLVVAETTGGIGRHVRLLAEQLIQRDHDVTLVGPPTSLAALDPPRFDLAQVPLPIGSVRRLRVARRELRLLVSGSDLIHAHGLRAGAVAVMARRPVGAPTTVPVVVTWHNAPLLGGLGGIAQRQLMRYVARGADLTLGASPDLTAQARRAGARDARDTFVVAPPLPQARRSRAEIRGELGVGDRPMVLAVGRLQRQKRLDTLVAAAAQWAGGAASPLVVVAGTGPEESTLRRRAHDTAAPVRFLGPRADVADLLTAADVVALPSEWEARSLVAQEALRAGVPLVTTPVGGLPDLLGDAAITVPVGDPPALRDAIERVIRDRDLRERLRAAGRDRAATWPTVEASVEALCSTYRSLVRTR